MTDETNNERPKPPPGWEWQELGDETYPIGRGCDWVGLSPDDLEGTAVRCWEHWARQSGISREKWEQMVRDHEAMEAARAVRAFQRAARAMRKARSAQ